MDSKTITLPSGKTAEIKPGKGKHLLNATRKAKQADEVVFALISELVTLDGEPILYEDLLEMDLPDVVALQGEVSGSFLTSPPVSTSSISPNTPAGN